LARPSKLTDRECLLILNEIANSRDRKDILATLKRKIKIGNNTLGNWLEYLEKEEGVCLKIPKTVPNLFELTTKGRQRVNELRDSITHAHPGINESLGSLFSLDNYSVKYPVIQKGIIWTASENQLNGFLQQIDAWKDCTIRVNHGKNTTSIEVQPNAMFGQDKDRLLHKARAICDSAARILQDNFGFILSVGEINRDFSIELRTVETMALYGEIGYVKDFLDASKMRGEMVFSGKDPSMVSEAAQRWQDAPKEISSIKNELLYMHEANDMLQSAVVSLIQEVRTMAGSIKTLIDGMKAGPQPPQQPGTGEEVR
jgi:hypothetical protein